MATRSGPSWLQTVAPSFSSSYPRTKHNVLGKGTVLLVCMSDPWSPNVLRLARMRANYTWESLREFATDAGSTLYEPGLAYAQTSKRWFLSSSSLSPTRLTTIFSASTIDPVAWPELSILLPSAYRSFYNDGPSEPVTDGVGFLLAWETGYFLNDTTGGVYSAVSTYTGDGSIFDAPVLIGDHMLVGQTRSHCTWGRGSSSTSPTISLPLGCPITTLPTVAGRCLCP